MAHTSIITIKKACSAKTGEGLVAGLEWLADRVTLKKNTNFPNNPYKLNSYNIVEQETARSRSSWGTSQIVQNLNNSHVLPETKETVMLEEKIEK